MKKLFKNQKIKYLVFAILGLLIGGSVGITATTYVLQSSEIQYDSNKSVQQAIDELYTLAENAGGSIETLPVGTVTVSGYSIIVPYTGSYTNVSCVYGTSTSYGNTGTISNNTCTFRGTSSSQTLYYKIVAVTTDNDKGQVYINSGSATTGTCNNDDNGNCIAATNYVTGDAIKLGRYNWHVISDTGTNLTLLMDAKQLGSYSNMAHCTNDTNSSTDCGVDSTGSYYVYSWDKSKIRTYLNGTFLTDLQSKITNTIVSTEICADPSIGDGSITYGGYLMSELSALGKTSSCTTKVTDKVRLISYSEYYNMSPYYKSTNSRYPNVGNYITKILSSSDYASWLYCSSTSCGDSTGYWWPMGSYSSSLAHGVQVAQRVSSDGGLYSGSDGSTPHGVRPVITIVK